MTVRVVRLYNEVLRKELLISLWHIVALRDTNTGGIVYLSNERSYVLGKEDYVKVRTAYLALNTEVWEENTRFDLAALMTN